MARKIRNSVVVITGASSGIGRATAHAFAKEGASLVLGARDEDALQAVVVECEVRGAQAIAVPADVSKERDVKELASRALTTFGRIDVWINNAAVSAFGRIEDMPTADIERVLHTNLFGSVYGARLVLPAFREQGGGVLIFVSSIVGAIGQPYTSAYAASKWAVRGLAASLRMEVRDVPGIHICTVLPATIDTPLFQHAANYTGRALRPMDPVYAPEDAAAVIVDLARHPRREAFVGGAGRMAAVGTALSAALGERMMARRTDRLHFRDSPAPDTQGNLYRPTGPESVHGGWLRRRVGGRTSAGAVGFAVAGVALVAVPLSIYAWRRSRTELGMGR